MFQQCSTSINLKIMNLEKRPHLQDNRHTRALLEGYNRQDPRELIVTL